MKKRYGLWSLIFGILAIPGAPLLVPPVLAVYFAILYKAKGDPADARQHRFARAGAVMGSVMLGLLVMALEAAILPDSAFSGMVMVFSLLAVQCLCLMLYERNRNKSAATVQQIPSVPVSAPSPKPIVLPDRAAESTAPQPLKPAQKPFSLPQSSTSLEIYPLRGPSHSGECDHGYYLVKEQDLWYLEQHTAYAKPGGTTQYSQKRTPLTKDFFRNGSIQQLDALLPRPLSYFSCPNYAAIRDLFPENPLTEPFVACQEHNFQPTAQYMCELFQTDMESWVYYDYVALDVRNGKAYLVHSEVRHVGGAYGSQEYFTAITYDRVRSLAVKAGKGDLYNTLHEDTWERFIPDGRRQEIEKYTRSTPREIPAAKPSGSALCEFFLEVHNLHAHHIVYLRETRQGYRIFSISATGWNYGLHFRFRPSEAMIRDIMEGRYGHDFNAFDRLLTPSELNSLQALAQKVAENDKEKPSYVSGYYILHPGNRHNIHTNHWYHFSNTLSAVAQHGCIVTDK